MNLDENYINSLKQQIKIVEEQNKLLEDLFNDYIGLRKIGYCESLKIYIKGYYGNAHLWYENILHKLGYSKRKEE